MTREEIIAMKPGRELDALVAEKVMEYVEDELFLISQAIGPHTFDRDGFTVAWCPSTDISAAWEVVEKMTEQPKPFVYHIARKSFGWESAFVPWGRVTGSWAMSFNAPEAICKAALLAVLEEIA